MLWSKTPERRKVAEIFEILKEKDPGKRLDGIPPLVGLGSRSPELLPELVDDENMYIRTSAAFAMSNVIRNIPELRHDLAGHAFEMLKHEDYVIRTYAASLLGTAASVSPESVVDIVPRLANLVGEGGPQGYFACLAAGEIALRCPTLVEPIMPKMMGFMLLGEKPTCERSLIALERISRKAPILLHKFVPELMACIKKTKEPSMGLEAAVMLARVSISSSDVRRKSVWPLASRLMGDESVIARAASVYLMGEIGLREPELVMDAISQVPSFLQDNAAVRSLLAIAIGRIGSRLPVMAENAMPSIMRLIDDSDLLTRAAAAVSLRYIAMSYPEVLKEALPSIGALLEDSDPTKRSIAAIGVRLVASVSTEFNGEVMDRALDLIAERDVEARRRTAVAFRMISRCYHPEVDDGIITDITELLDDDDSTVRDNGLLAIRDIISGYPDLAKEWAPRVATMFNDTDSTVRAEAAYVIGEVAISDPILAKHVALPGIIRLLDDEPSVSSNAAFSLGRIM